MKTLRHEKWFFSDWHVSFCFVRSNSGRYRPTDRPIGLLSSLAVGDEVCIGQSKKLLCLCMEQSSLREMKACICPSGKLLCLWIYKIKETVYKGQQPNLFYNWEDMSLPLLQLKSSMVYFMQHKHAIVVWLLCRSFCSWSSFCVCCKPRNRSTLKIWILSPIKFQICFWNALTAPDLSITWLIDWLINGRDSWM